MNIIIENNALFVEHKFSGNGVAHKYRKFFGLKTEFSLDETYLIFSKKFSIYELESYCRKYGFSLKVDRSELYNDVGLDLRYVTEIRYTTQAIMKLSISECGNAFYIRNKTLPVIDRITDKIYKAIDKAILETLPHSAISSTVCHFEMLSNGVHINDNMWDSCDGISLFEDYGMAPLKNMNEYCGMALIVHDKILDYLKSNYSNSIDEIITSTNLLYSFGEGVELRYRLKKIVPEKSFTEWK